MRTDKIVFVAAFGMIVAANASATSQESTPADGADGDGAVCMTQEGGAEGGFSVLVPAVNIQAMKAKGFVLDDCSRRFRTMDQRRAWRDRICKFTAEQSEVLQRQYESQFGERPAVLCGMAELVVGSWVRGQDGLEGGSR